MVLLAGVAVAGGLLLVTTQPAHASILGDVGDKIAGWIAGILFAIATVLGKLLLVAIELLLAIVTYNNFTDTDAVVRGWVIVRDIGNMLFVLILLTMAFGTILRIQTYRWSRLLGRIIMMAILINFSRMIAGFFIDIAQVIMLTFVNAFAQNAAGTFTNVWGLNDLLSFLDQPNPPAGVELLGSAFFMNVLLVVAIVVMFVMVLVFLMRIIMLWILVVLSPIAYLLYAFPAGQRYASQWWGAFGRYVVIGPVLAFFIWFSLYILGQFPAEALLNKPRASVSGQTEELSATVIKAGSSTNILNFIIATAMLVGSLMVARQMGGMAGAAASTAIGKLRAAGAGAIRAPLRLGRAALRGAGQVTAGGFDALSRARPVREGLARVGASGIPLVRDLAARTLVASAQREKSYEEQAERYARFVPDTRVRSRYANARFAITPKQRAMQRAFRKQSPSTINKEDELIKFVEGMDDEALRKVKDAEWAAIGRRGIRLGALGRGDTIIRKDRDALGAYNRGRSEFFTAKGLPDGLDTVGEVGLNQNNRPLTGSNRFGNVPSPGTTYYDRVMREGKSKHQYRLVEDEERPAAAKAAKRGEGNLSVGKFDTGQSNALAVDFDKLGLEFLRPTATQKFSQTKGINIDDRGEIRQVASKMVGVLDQEIGKLRQQGGQDRRIQELERSRERFSKPESFDRLNLLNSSSEGYGVRDLMKTHVHEDYHATGVKDEESVTRLTEHTMQNRIYSLRKGIGGSVAAGESNVNDILTKERGSLRAEFSARPRTRIRTETPPVSENVGKQVQEAADFHGQLEQMPVEEFAKNANEIAEQVKKLSEGLKQLGGKIEGVPNVNTLENQVRTGQFTPEQWKIFTNDFGKLAKALEERTSATGQKPTQPKPPQPPASKPPEEEIFESPFA